MGHHDHSLNFPECEQFTLRMREICRGEAGLPLDGNNSTNAYRVAWGLPPLTSVSAEIPAPVAPAPAHRPPPLIVRGWNFASAMARWALAGRPCCSRDEIDARLAICQSCEFLRNQHCVKCGCACNDQNRLMNKLALATERCPIGKWSTGGEAAGGI